MDVATDFEEGQWRWARGVVEHTTTPPWHLTTDGEVSICFSPINAKSQVELGDFVPSRRCNSCIDKSKQMLGIQ